MNREILFRAKAIEGGDWVYGDLEYNHKKDIARIHTYRKDGAYKGQVVVDQDTIGQFVGLCDKNGNKIFEGDVVGIAESGTSRYVVKFGDGMFFASFANEYDIWENCPLWVVADKFSVIGNIYDKKKGK